MTLITPEPCCSKIFDCAIVGDKWKSLLEDESHHSKWEELRRLAKTGSDHEECSQLLRRMELQDSKEEYEIGEDAQDTQMTLEDAYMSIEEMVAKIF